MHLQIQRIILRLASIDQFIAAAKILYLMLQQGFKQVTYTVYNQEYEHALQEMNKLIADDPQNSILYSNRALLLSQLQRDQESVKDLLVAIQLNPRNYIAYFNMFSILYRLEQDNQAYQQLCCSLSCLHLMRARLLKSIEQADKAIKYSHNNVEAHLLKGLIYSSQGKHVQAYSAFDEATSIDPSNESLFSLKAISYTKAFPGERQPKDYYDAQQYKTIEKKLKCTYRVQQNLQEHHFQQKLNQFNALYSEVNNQIGAVTQKVNKTQTIISAASYERSRAKDGMVLIEDQGQPTPKPSEVRPQPGNLYICSLKISKISQSQCNIDKQVAKNDSQEEEEEFKSILNSSPDQNDYFSSILQSKIQEEAKQINIQDDNQKQEPLVLFTPEMSQNLNLHECSSIEVNNTDKALPQEVEQKFESILSHHEQIQSTPTTENIIDQHYNLIYPLDLHYQLKFSVIKLQFTEMTVQYSGLYCIITYSRKLTTLTKSTVNNVCLWNQQFNELTIPTQPTDMKIKIYNKKYQSIRDEYIGQVEVLITTADLLKLPIYNKKGQILGEILVQLQLVLIEQKEQVKQEECEP